MACCSWSSADVVPVGEVGVGEGAGRDSLDALEILGGHEALNQGDVRAMGLIERKALGERLQQAGIGDLRVGQHRGVRLQQHVNGGEGKALRVARPAHTRMPRQLDSLLAPPRWNSSITMKSKKSGGYWPNQGEGLPSGADPLMKVWKMVMNTLALVGTRPFLRRSPGSIRASALSSKAAKLVKSLKA